MNLEQFIYSFLIGCIIFLVYYIIKNIIKYRKELKELEELKKNKTK